MRARANCSRNWAPITIGGMPLLMSCEPRKPQTETQAMNPIIDSKVLFVEDEETLRHAVAKMLEKRGFSVIEAREGRAAIDILRRNCSHIGVVLLDVKLPDIGGVDVFFDMCLIKPAIKVILTTGFNVELAAATAGEHRPWGLIQKPYEIDELASLLRTALAA
jgi:two-component system, cell cycle sensor histidine kinase and response regulator CckA